MELRVGARLGDYEILGHIGAGGSGAVYRARHCLTGRIEAIKVLHAAAGDTIEQSERFMREIRVQASLQHPNIAAVHNAQQFEGRLVMVMEYVDGASLRELIDLGLLPLENAIGIACQALDALEYAHSRELVHRDIKPENILVNADGLVKLTDFGLAKMVHSTELTANAAPLGSMWYISPEQVQSAKVIDHRADIYSLGAVLYEMVAGRPPFTGDNFYELMKGHVEKTPRPPIEFNPEISEDLNAAILMALEKSPERRFVSAAQFRTALLYARAEARLPATSVPRPRRWLTAAALTSAVVAVASVGAWQRGQYEIPLPPAASAALIRPPDFAYRRTPDPPPSRIEPSPEPVDVRKPRTSAPSRAPVPETAKPASPESGVLAGALASLTHVEPIPSEPAASLSLSPAPPLQPDLELLRALRAGEEASRILLGPKGRAIAAMSSRSVKAWDVQTGEVLLETGELREALTAMALSPREDTLFLGDVNGTVRVWDLRSGREPAALGHEAGVTALASGADGGLLIVSLKDRTIQLWRRDEADGKYKRAYRSFKNRSGRPLALAFNGAVNRLVTAAEDDRIEVWEAIGAGKPVRMGTAAGSVTEVALSPDGVLIAAAGGEGAALWHAPSRRRVAAVATGGQRHALAFTSGRRCVAAAGGGRTLRLWDVISASPLAEVVLNGVAEDVSITDDAARVGALDASGQIHVWRLNEAARQALQEPFNSERLAALLAKAPPQPQRRKGVLKRLTEALPFGPDSSASEEKRE